MAVVAWCHGLFKSTMWPSRTDHIAHPLGLQESPVAEGGDLVNAHPNTKKTAQACGCVAEDHSFISRAALQV